MEVIKKDPPQWVIDEVEEYNKDCIAQEKLAEKGNIWRLTKNQKHLAKN